MSSIFFEQNLIGVAQALCMFALFIGFFSWIASVLMRLGDILILKDALSNGKVIRLDGGVDHVDIATRRRLHNLLKKNSIQSPNPVVKIISPFHLDTDTIHTSINHENKEIVVTFNIQSSIPLHINLYEGLPDLVVANLCVNRNSDSSLMKNSTDQDLEMNSMSSANQSARLDPSIFQPVATLVTTPSSPLSTDPALDTTISLSFPLANQHWSQTNEEDLIPLIIHAEDVKATFSQLAVSHFSHLSPSSPRSSATGTTIESESLGAVNEAQHTTDLQTCLSRVRFDQHLVRHETAFTWTEVYGIYGLDEEEEPECSVCLTENKEILILPCRHVCLCRTCHLRCDKCPGMCHVHSLQN